MQLAHIQLLNWKNFRSLDIDLSGRMFIVGQNASGKSNFLDAFRFLKDIAKSGGGLQKAVIEDRGGISKIRNLAARKSPVVEISVIILDQEKEIKWTYHLAFRWKSEFPKQLEVAKEIVTKNDEILLERPDKDDRQDPRLLTQTALEQISANKQFRDIATYFGSFRYRHLVPQLVRYPNLTNGKSLTDDPFGYSFLQQVATTDKRVKNARLRKIEKALNIAVPQLEHLNDVRDEFGNPHLEAVYKHWRPEAGKQREDQFSDGTLRLIGLLWTILESKSLLLLEEPELSLHDAIISKLPSLMQRINTKGCQIFTSTHSAALLSDKSISAEEILVLYPDKEGTKGKLARDIAEIKLLLQHGMSAADAVIPATAPENIDQLSLFE